MHYARKNIARNDLEARVRLVPRSSTDKLIPLDDLDIQSAAFVMTNPPFYESSDELEALARKKSRPPLTACTGAPIEMVTPGGEVGFAERILAESLAARDRVAWYSTMLGKHASLEAVVETLRESEVDNYAVTEFIQGTKTRRWAVAWSFGDMRPSGDVARGMKELSWGKVLPPRTEYEIVVKARGLAAGTLGRCIDELMQELGLMSWEWDAEGLTGLGRAGGNVWGRAWRRRQQRIERGEDVGLTPGESADKDPLCAIGFRISVIVGLEDYRVVCRWVQGREAALVTSLFAFLRGRLEKFDALQGQEMYVVR